MLEESGWRGFAMPVALRRQGPLGASLRVGLLWATWHVPVKFNLFLDHGALGGSAVLAAFTLKLLAISVVMTFFWARAGQATILAIAIPGGWHALGAVDGAAETPWLNDNRDGRVLNDGTASVKCVFG